MDPKTPPKHEMDLRMALSLVADKYGKQEALRIVAEWARTKIDVVATV